jgi:predicted transcriptional regulator of viral defense system
MKQTIGNLERQLFAYVQLRNIKTVRTGDLVKVLQITQKQERELLSRLSRSGLIANVRRGLYLVPQRLPLGGTWSPDQTLALNTLMEDKAGSYQICGPNAFNRYGFDDQIPARVYAYNNRISGERTIGSVSFTLIKVSDTRLGDVEKVKSSDGEIAYYSSRKRTLLDAVYDWSRFNTLPRAYGWIQMEVISGRVLPEDFVKVTLKYGDIGSIRRIGFLLENMGVSETLLGKLNNAIKSVNVFIPFVPEKSRKGKIDLRWGIIDNQGKYYVRI